MRDEGLGTLRGRRREDHEQALQPWPQRREDPARRRTLQRRGRLIEDVWNWWQTRKASAHYQVESSGRIGQLVWDRDTA
jgi:hypothetical protein